MTENGIKTLAWIAAIAAAWIAWEIFKACGPKPPKKPYDVGKVTVRVVFIDASSSVYEHEVIGDTIEWNGRHEIYDAIKVAKEFIDGKRPIHLGDQKYAPRHRVHRYIIQPREEHIIYL